MIDYLILTNTRSEKDFQMTSALIKSLAGTRYPPSGEFSRYRITLVETNRSSGGFRYDGIDGTVYFDMSKYGRFNYNYAINLGTIHCFATYADVDWICILNNDVTCDTGWIEEIAKAVSNDGRIQSICPNVRAKRDGVVYGYTLFRHLDGCCIMHRKQILDRIGMWDEAFEFAYQDDDYLERLRLAGIVHAKVLSSKIFHTGGGTQEYTQEIGMRGIGAFIRKYGYELFARREREKPKIGERDAL